MERSGAPGVEFKVLGITQSLDRSGALLDVDQSNEVGWGRLARS